jgi:phosphoribosylaminoimidazole-succinocarboxamide synthase
MPENPATISNRAPGPAVFRTDLNLPDAREGKVRDVYRLPAGLGSLGGVASPGGMVQPGGMVLIASDRISAFDVVMPTPIQGKGRLLTQISLFWMRLIEDRGLCRTHVITDDPAVLPASAFTGKTTRADLVGRFTLGKRCRVIPIECVVRGYLEGSGWKEYQQSGSVCGIRLPVGLRQCERLPEPIFTPATKEEQGKHDENISFERAAAAVGEKTMEFLRSTSLAIYRAASEHALARGIILADTKFEFGIELDEAGKDVGTTPILIDEALTPDSSRFWPADDHQPGRAQKSYDKQFLREYLETLTAAGKWGKVAPGPELPAEVVAKTLEKYQAAYDRLTA